MTRRPSCSFVVVSGCLFLQESIDGIEQEEGQQGEPEEGADDDPSQGIRGLSIWRDDRYTSGGRALFQRDDIRGGMDN